MIHWRIDPAGPQALIIRFGDDIDPAQLPLIRAARDRLAQTLKGQVRDLVPAYNSLTVHYSLLRTDYPRLSEAIQNLLADLQPRTAPEGRLVKIPVWYHPQVGPDLERLAHEHQVSVEEIIRRHSGRDYSVFAIGFAPGFAYLGPVAEELATPRLDRPRSRVPRGSVALAERQTAVYPLATPGGWNILGRTPLAMFDRELENLCPVSMGDKVRFVPIDREEFLAAGGRLDA